MRRNVAVAAVVLLLCTASFAKSKKSDLNRQITHAQYVIVTTYYGNGVTNLSMPAEDRQAMVAVETALKKWGRFHVVYSPEMADIVVLVRKGRYASLTGGGTVGTGGISIGTGEPRIPGTVPDDRPIGGRGAYGGAEAGMPDDELSIFEARTGLEGSPLWRRTQHNGLRGPKIPLLEELKKEVQEADKEDAAKKKP